MSAPAEEPSPASVPATVKAYAAVVVGSYLVRAVAGDGDFPWGQMIISALLVAGVARGWAIPWAFALLIDLVPVSLAVYLTSFSTLTPTRTVLLALGVASLVLLLLRPTRRYVFGPLPPRGTKDDGASGH